MGNRFRFWFRIPHRDHNGHFRWLHGKVSDGFTCVPIWGQKRCLCDTDGFGSGFKKIGEPQLCTGLKGADGNLIFEGDMVKLPEDLPQFQYKPIEEVRYIEGTFYAGYQLRDIYRQVTVIGNIYENPELLKQEQACTI